MGSDKIKHKAAASTPCIWFRPRLCLFALVKVKRESGKVGGGFRSDLWLVSIASQMAFGSSLGPPGIGQRAQSSDEETREEETSPWFNGDSDVNPGWCRALMALSCPLNFSAFGLKFTCILHGGTGGPTPAIYTPATRFQWTFHLRLLVFHPKEHDKQPLTLYMPPAQSQPCDCKCPYGSSSSSSSKSGREGELLLGRGRTDVVRGRISQQHAKLWVLQNNGGLGVFYSAGKEECFVPEQNMTFLLDLRQPVLKSVADVSIWPAAIGFHPQDSPFMTELLRLAANSWNFSQHGHPTDWFHNENLNSPFCSSSHLPTQTDGICTLVVCACFLVQISASGHCLHWKE